MQNPFAYIKGKIRPYFNKFRQWLEKIRCNNPKFFDFFAELVKVAIPFIGCFTPAFLNSTAGLAIGNLILFSALLILQWAELKNEGDRRVAEEKKNNDEEIKILEELYGEDEKVKFENAVEKLKREREFSYDVANFSHLVSHNVKMLVTEIIAPLDGRMIRRLVDFFQEGINSIEDILGKHYNVNIRASIKLSIDTDHFKTYARGKQNVISRGGELAVHRLNGRKVEIEDNYAYEAIVHKDLTYFSEGNLTSIHNKFEEDDVFYCEYDNFLDIFYATFIMPIRVPWFEKGADHHIILGLVCIDCLEEMPCWNEPDFNTKVGYHIVADYADSLALLIEKFKG